MNYSQHCVPILLFWWLSMVWICLHSRRQPPATYLPGLFDPPKRERGRVLCFVCVVQDVVVGVSSVVSAVRRDERRFPGVYMSDMVRGQPRQSAGCSLIGEATKEWRSFWLRSTKIAQNHGPGSGLRGRMRGLFGRNQERSTGSFDSWMQSWFSSTMRWYLAV